jgi:hypothetical protein
VSNFGLRTPCGNCPLRTDIEVYLRPERVSELVESMRNGYLLPCHKTTVDSDEDDGERVATKDSMFCAGQLITMEKEGFSHQMVRIGERIGAYDLTKMNLDAPVYPSLAAWARAARGDDEEGEYEHCDVVSDECEDPPGFMFGGNAVASADAPACPADHTCGYCGKVMCEPCTGEPDDDGTLRCIYCTEES